MAKLSAFISFLLLTTIVYGQNKSLELRKISVATFDSAKARSVAGIEEVGRMRFKYAKGTSLTQLNNNGYTWFSVLEKTGRLLVTDSVKAAGVILKMNRIESEVDFKSILYRNTDGKIKKVNLDEDNLQITEQGDTSFYKLDLKSAQPNDILQITYSITSKINSAPRWSMINDISPGTTSRLDLYIPVFLEYKLAFKGFKADQIRSISEESKQVITFETPRPLLATKSTSEQQTVTAKVVHGTYLFSSKSRQKYIVATLVQETAVE